MPELALTSAEQAILAGEDGETARLALGIIVRMARVLAAERLRPIASAHIDGCLYHGQASLDFAARLADAGGRVRVPTTLNVGSLDLIHPDHYRGDPETGRAARRLMEAYTAMGCQPTWTCAPYQLPSRPGVGEHVAWAESNAIVFANSVLGARTNRYGDFLDICAALTGLVPDAGLHRTEHRRGQIRFDLGGLPPGLLGEDVVYPVLGHLIGLAAGTAIPVLDGLPRTVTEDQFKALGAAAASSGAVALFHAVGLTPEATTLRDACQGREPERVVRVTPAMVARARDALTTAPTGKLAAVSLGTPHFSVLEFAQLVPLLENMTVHPSVDCYVSTGRWVLTEVERRGWLPTLERAGVRLVVDTCTYITPILPDREGIVMTNSAKWAYYAPGNLGREVAFGSLHECVRSAVLGRVWRDDTLWKSIGG